MKYVVNVYGCKIPTGESAIRVDTEALHDRLQQALQNKFPEDDFYYTLIDVDSGDNLTDHDENLIEQLKNDDLSSPLVTINDEIVAHGDLKMESIIRWLEQNGADPIK